MGTVRHVRGREHVSSHACTVVQAPAEKATSEDTEDAAVGDGTAVAPPPLVVPGTQALGDVATAAAAALEKVGAGENRAVEHVAMDEGDLAGNLLSQKD